MPTVLIDTNYRADALKSDTTYIKSDNPSAVNIGRYTVWGINYDYRAGMRFPLTSLPSGVTITSLKLYCFVTLTGGGVRDIHPYNGDGQADPEADAASVFWGRCGGGTPYIDDTAEFSTLDGKLFNLPSQAINDLINAKNIVNRFSLGFHEEGDDDPYAQITFSGTNGWKQGAVGAPDGGWTNYGAIDDDNTLTAGYGTIPAKSWSTFVVDSYRKRYCDLIRIYAENWVDYPALVDVDIDRGDGNWIDVYQGSYPDKTWFEIPLPPSLAGLVYQVRVRFYNSFFLPVTLDFYELDTFGYELPFLEITYEAPPPPWGGDTHHVQMAKAILGAYLPWSKRFPKLTPRIV